MAHLVETKEPEKSVMKDGKDHIIVDDQNEPNVGVANRGCKTSPSTSPRAIFKHEQTAYKVNKSLTRFMYSALLQNE